FAAFPTPIRSVKWAPIKSRNRGMKTSDVPNILGGLILPTFFVLGGLPVFGRAGRAPRSLQAHLPGGLILPTFVVLGGLPAFGRAGRAPRSLQPLFQQQSRCHLANHILEYLSCQSVLAYVFEKIGQRPRRPLRVLLHQCSRFLPPSLPGPLLS